MSKIRKYFLRLNKKIEFSKNIIFIKKKTYRSIMLIKIFNETNPRSRLKKRSKTHNTFFITKSNVYTNIKSPKNKT